MAASEHAGGQAGGGSGRGQRQRLDSCRAGTHSVCDRQAAPGACGSVDAVASVM